MDSYDIVLDSCETDSGFAGMIGFKQLGVVGRGIGMIDADRLHNIDSVQKRSIAFGSDAGKLSALVRKGVAAVHVSEFRIDRKLIEDIAANDCVLCISTKEITNTYGAKRARMLYKASRLFRLAKKRKIRVAFATMASSLNEMLSKIQLIEIAKLIGADEQYARYSIGEINGYLVNGDD